MADITLRELLEHWQSKCTDYVEGELSTHDLEQTLDELGSSLGYYSEIVPSDITVPAPADWDD